MILNKLLLSIGCSVIALSSCGLGDKQVKSVDESIKSSDDYFEETSLRYEDKIYKEGIATPIAFVGDWETSYPFLKLNSGQAITFMFDDLNDKLSYYNYKIIHCDRNWNPSDLMTSEFLDGFDGNPINDWVESFNTYVKYVNYQLILPNDDVKFTKSGNYILFVYEDDEEMPVLTKRFVIYEEQANISSEIKRPTDIDDMAYKQQINLSIDISATQVSDPFRELDLCVLQNGRWDNAIRSVNPQFVQDQVLSFEYQDELCPWGNAEYRPLDLKSTRYRGEKIDKIQLEADHVYHFYLLPETSLGHTNYITSRDINGKFLIKDEEAQNQHTDADYTTVHFKLKADRPYEEGNVYVYGSFCTNPLDDTYRMTYNKENKVYELELQLKQGYYNYMYAIPNKEGVMDVAEIEGTHYETENDYAIIVYRKNFSEGYDQIIGLKIKNTVQ